MAVSQNHDWLCAGKISDYEGISGAWQGNVVHRDHGFIRQVGKHFFGPAEFTLLCRIAVVVEVMEVAEVPVI